MFKPVELINVVDTAYQDKLYELVTDIKFPWYFLEDTTDENKGPGRSSTPAFVNLVYHQGQENNPYSEFFIPLINGIVEKANMNLDSIIRVRLGFLLNTKYTFAGSPYQYNTPHVDGEEDHWTAVYYLNQCDGETVIFRETEKSPKYYPLYRCMPEKGKAVLFDGKHYHASTCPKIFNKRIACTINFKGSFKNG